MGLALQEEAECERRRQPAPSTQVTAVSSVSWDPEGDRALPPSGGEEQTPSGKSWLSEMEEEDQGEGRRFFKWVMKYPML